MFIKITNIKNETGLINSDHLQTVDTIDGKVRLYFIGNVTITISLEEYVRIEPLLLSGTPAVAETDESASYSALPVDRTASYYALSDAFQKAGKVSNWQDVGLILYPYVSYFLKGETPKMPKVGEDQYNRLSPLPTALVSAYREYQRMLSLTGISQHRIDMQRAILIDLLGANMPLEETDHE